MPHHGPSFASIFILFDELPGKVLAVSLPPWHSGGVSPETYSAPSDLHVSVLEGWSITAIRGDQSPQPAPTVRLGRVLVPRIFEMLVSPKTTAMSKVSQPGGWVVSLMYEAEEDGSGIMLTGLISSLIEVDEALAELRARRPLTWWKRYALRRIAFDAFDHALDFEPDRAEEALAARRAFLSNNVRAALEMPLARRRNRITHSHLAEVAQIYKAAVDAGEHPTQAVAKALNVSHSAASKYVGKARQEGLLDKTRRGVAGKRGRA